MKYRTSKKMVRKNYTRNAEDYRRTTPQNRQASPLELIFPNFLKRAIRETITAK